MATFAKSTFNATVYSASRPTYPQQLFEYIFNYHRRKPNAKWERAIDLGCGTGQATGQLQPFGEIIGLDPSDNMINTAKSNPQFNSQQFQFRRGRGEDMKAASIADESVDLAIAAQACHWFDWNKVWPETSRVLRSGGTAAYWVYSEFRLPSFPSVTPIITAYAQGTDPVTSLGPHFQRPGRTILENHLLDVPSPHQLNPKLGSTLINEKRVYFAGDYHPTLPPSHTLPVIMRKKMRWRDLLGYFRTWSSLHEYHVHFPQDKTLPHDGRFPEDLEQHSSHSLNEAKTNVNVNVGNQDNDNSADSETDIDVRGGDIAIRFWKDLRSAALEATGGKARVGVDDPLDVEWPVALVLVSKA